MRCKPTFLLRIQLDNRLKPSCESDTTIVNLEAAVPAGPPVPKSGPNIGADEQLFHTPSTLGVDATTIANNHLMDFGPAGLQDTIQTCRDNSMDPFGAGTTQSESLEPLERQVGDSTVGIFGLSEHEIGIAGRNEPGVCWIRSPEVLTQLQSRSQEFDVSIVVAHGGVEYVPLPPSSWRSLLRTIATLDVDLVVGHHPHNMQGSERYDGTPIHYSLGNFLMYNDYFKGPQWGCLLDVNIDDGEVETHRRYLRLRPTERSHDSICQPRISRILTAVRRSYTTTSCTTNTGKQSRSSCTISDTTNCSSTTDRVPSGRLSVSPCLLSTDSLGGSAVATFGTNHDWGSLTTSLINHTETLYGLHSIYLVDGSNDSITRTSKANSTISIR